MRSRYNPRKEHSLRRRAGFKPVKKTFLIVCEGVNTEPEYFNAFRLTSATVKAIGKGLGTMALVREAISVRDLEKQRGKIFNFCWVVFDKDDYQDFNEAIEFANKNGFEVAYSNQAFELWFLLHFKKYSGKLHRREYPKLLEKHIGFSYSKQGGFARMLFQILLPFQSTAITNAETIIAETQGIKPSLAESSTTVHILVKKLNEYSDINNIPE